MSTQEIKNGHRNLAVSEGQDCTFPNSDNVFEDLIRHIDVAVSKDGFPYVAKTNEKNETEYLPIDSKQVDHMNYWAIFSVKCECTDTDLAEFNFRVKEYVLRFGRVALVSEGDQS